MSQIIKACDGSAGVQIADLLGATEHALVIGAATGALTSLAVAGNGFIPIGSVGADPVLATLTNGTNINIVNGPGAITINATGAGIGPTFEDDVFRVLDDGDNTRELAFQCSQITSGNTRTITIANHDMNMDEVADAFVTDGTTAIPTASSIAIDGASGGNITTNGIGDTVYLDFSTNTNLTTIHGWNGSFIETADVIVTAAGGVITLSIEKEGGGNLTAVFSDGYYTYVTAPDTVTLTAGTDVAPTLNYVYLLQSTKTLTASTVGWLQQSIVL